MAWLGTFCRDLEIVWTTLFVIFLGKVSTASFCLIQIRWRGKLLCGKGDIPSWGGVQTMMLSRPLYARGWGVKGEVVPGPLYYWKAKTWLSILSTGIHYYHILYALSWAFLAVFWLVRWSCLNDQAILLEYNTFKGTAIWLANLFGT